MYEWLKLKKNSKLFSTKQTIEKSFQSYIFGPRKKNNNSNIVIGSDSSEISDDSDYRHTDPSFVESPKGKRKKRAEAVASPKVVASPEVVCTLDIEQR